MLHARARHRGSSPSGCRIFHIFQAWLHRMPSKCFIAYAHSSPIVSPPAVRQRAIPYDAGHAAPVSFSSVRSVDGSVSPVASIIISLVPAPHQHLCSGLDLLQHLLSRSVASASPTGADQKVMLLMPQPKLCIGVLHRAAVTLLTAQRRGQFFECHAQFGQARLGATNRGLVDVHLGNAARLAQSCASLAMRANIWSDSRPPRFIQSAAEASSRRKRAVRGSAFLVSERRE